VQTKSLADTYSSKTDEELIALATNPDCLLEEARTVLADELQRRNIAVTKPSDPEKTSAPRNTAINKLLRFVGAFALNLAIAILGTTVVESPIWSTWSQFGRAHSVHGIEAREWFLSLTIAALLGFFIGRRRTTTIYLGLDAASHILRARSVDVQWQIEQQRFGWWRVRRTLFRSQLLGRPT
jgi:hypothetical protein